MTRRLGSQSRRYGVIQMQRQCHELSLMPGRGEGRPDRASGPQVHPVPGWIVAEGRHSGLAYMGPTKAAIAVAPPTVPVPN